MFSTVNSKLNKRMCCRMRHSGANEMVWGIRHIDVRLNSI